MTRAIYSDSKFAELERFGDEVHAAAREVSGGKVLDSASCARTSRTILSDNSISKPEAVEELLSVVPDEYREKVLDSIVGGIDIFQKEHGRLPTGDLLAAAVQQGMSASKELDRNGRVLDSAISTGSSTHHDQISAQPNRIVVATLAALAEAIPFAAYLPSDINSNESRLGILTHRAGKTFGSYVAADSMDGVNIGKPYLSSERTVELTLGVGRDTATGKITGVTGGNEDTVLLRGRTEILVNGYPCASESRSNLSTASTSAISGQIRIGSTDYTITGTVTVNTGAVSLAFSPALPENTKVHAIGYIDYEKVPALTPKIETAVDTFTLLASPWRALADQTIDSRTQYGNEINIDLATESLMVVRNQFAMERHYAALSALERVAANNNATYDFDWEGQKQEKVRAQVWQDFASILGVADQSMAERTMDYGISYLYVDKNVAAQFRGMPRELFESSGITARPTIYRVGRLFGQYEVYYTPTLDYNGGTSKIICIGRPTQVARSPIVLGDAVPPTFMKLATGDDMRDVHGFYARNFTKVNPHRPSANGVAIITVSNQAHS